MSQDTPSPSTSTPLPGTNPPTITTTTSTNNSVSSKPCSRCHNPTQQTYILRKDPFCSPCLQSWILSRVVKRCSEGFRIPGGGRDSVRRVLLPLSGGLSSLALLHLLELHAAARINRSGRAGYEVVGLWVDQGAILAEGEEGDGEGFGAKVWEGLGRRFGSESGSGSQTERQIRWRMQRVAVQDVFSEKGPLDAEERGALMDALPLDESMRGLQPVELLTALLRALPEPSSRTDLLVSLRTRLITAFARSEQCSVIVWGDTTTRLAEKTLAETAKGRGFSLPWQTGDGETPFAGVKFMYPLQDLYRKEIELWAEVASDPSLTDIVPVEKMKSKNNKAMQTASTKNLTIDDLMKRYFAGVEEAYPSVVANVVRTSNKLITPRADDLVACGVCGLAFDSEVGGLVAWEGNQNHDVAGVNGDATSNAKSENGDRSVQKRLCYACSRTLDRAKILGAG